MTDRVLWVTKGLGRGGAEQLLLGLLKYIDRSRFEVEVAYLLPWKDALVGELEREGVVVHCVENRRPYDLRWMSRLRALTVQRQYALVHTHMPYVAAGARLVVPGSVPMVHTEHNLWDRYRAPTRLANLVTFNRNAAAIAVSAAVEQSIQVPSWVPGNLPDVEVIRHGADLALVRRGADARAVARERLGLDPGTIVVGSVANFTAKKDQGTLLEAVSMVVEELSVDVRLVLVGSGPLESELRDRASDLGIGEQVLFTGMRDDVYDLLPGFDVFALSSRFEGLPISLLEAMASGVPCVVTGVGGIPEVVTDGIEGRIVNPGDPRAFADALGELVRSSTLRESSGRAAASRAVAFSLEAAAERTNEVYLRALGGH